MPALFCMKKLYLLNTVHTALQYLSIRTVPAVLALCQTFWHQSGIRHFGIRHSGNDSRVQTLVNCYDIDHNYSQQWTMLTTYENAHKSGKCLYTIYKHAHNLRKYSQLAKMLTTCENAHTDDLQKCSQLKKENVHNLQKCSQPRISITTCKNAHIFQENTKHLYTSVEVLPPPCLTRNAYNT